MGEDNQLYDLIFGDEEITWQSLIYELIRSGEIDPWDVDISLLSKKFLGMLKKLKEMNFKISGKVVLASSILLKVKSMKLVNEDIANLDSLIAGTNEEDSIFYEEEDGGFIPPTVPGQEELKLYPRTPQPRKRKVSIYDLINALDKALEVRERRKFRHDSYVGAPEVHVPTKERDITLMITDVFQAVKQFFSKNKDGNLTFSTLVPSSMREDKIYTFIPLLHLDHQRAIDLIQEKHFGEIEIRLLNKEINLGKVKESAQASSK